MPNSPPRLRVFAGPNGSGKSSLFPQLVQQKHFKAIPYINADDLQSDLNKGVPVRFPIQDGSAFIRILLSGGFIRDRLLSAEVVKSLVGDLAKGLTLAKGAVCDGYLAAAIAEATRELFLAERSSFGFETVMSHRSKIEFLSKAREQGFKVYLYFVSTGDPLVNVERVKQRVREGGHDVPEDKIITRYGRSLELLSEAVQLSDRAYLFDSSGTNVQLVASVTGGKHIELLQETVPFWVERHLLSKAKPTG